MFAYFPAGTPSATKSGLKNIEEIQVGDEVWAYDETNGEVGLKPVINTFNRTTDLLVKIEIDGEIITATPEHPFYANGDWKAAGLLETGDNILLFSGKLATVKEVKYEGAHSPVEIINNIFEELEIIEENNTKVFNFEVEGWHTYFVGWLKVLVHNTGICVKELVKRLPRTKGKWAGEAGESIWNSSKKAVKKITNGEGIPFKNGFPDFNKWAKGKMKFKNLDGTAKDFDKVYERVAKQKGLKNKTEAKKYLKDKSLTPHHHQDGKTIELIPTALHSNVPHSGGASVLRNGTI